MCFHKKVLVKVSSIVDSTKFIFPCYVLWLNYLLKVICFGKVHFISRILIARALGLCVCRIVGISYNPKKPVGKATIKKAIGAPPMASAKIYAINGLILEQHGCTDTPEVRCAKVYFVAGPRNLSYRNIIMV